MVHTYSNRPEANGMHTIMTLAASHPNIVSLTIGMPVYTLEQSLKTHLSELVLNHEHLNKYPPFSGIPELRDAIAASLSAGHTQPFTRDNVLVTAGAMEALYLAAMAVCNSGDEVLVLTPCFPPQLIQIEHRGAEAIQIPMKESPRWEADSEALARAVTPKTKALLITSPNNPTGTSFDHDQMQSLIDFAAAHNIYLIADETYHFLNYTHEAVSLCDFVQNGKHVVIRSFSKQFAMTGLRVGYMAASTEFIERAAAIHENTTGFVSTFAQHAALAAIQSFPAEAARRYHDDFTKKRTCIMQELDSYADVMSYTAPEGAFFMFVAYKADILSLDLAKRLVEAGVAVFPGSTFGRGGEGHLRLSFAGSEDGIREGVKRLGTYLRSL